MKTVTYTIYMATNTVNGKRYIGITTRGLEVRKEQHLYLARSGSKGCNRLYDAIRKYGEAAFIWQMIASAKTEKEAFRIERALIKKIRRLSEEYNVTDGGEGGRSNAPYSEYTRSRMREFGLQNKDKWALYSHLGPLAARRKTVCLNTGEIFESAKAAAEAYDLPRSSVIQVCLRDPRRKTARGLVFRYFGDHKGGIEEAKKVLAGRDAGRKIGGMKCTKPIVCDTYGIRFSGALAASQEYCIPRNLISQVCSGHKPSAYGLKFSYVQD